MNFSKANNIYQPDSMHVTSSPKVLTWVVDVKKSVDMLMTDSHDNHIYYAYIATDEEWLVCTECMTVVSTFSCVSLSLDNIWDSTYNNIQVTTVVT